MLSNIGFDKLIVLLVAALVVLGPERLPGAVRQSMQFLGRARDYASGATEQLRDDVGPVLDGLREEFPQAAQQNASPHIVPTTDNKDSRR